MWLGIWVKGDDTGQKWFRQLWLDIFKNKVAFSPCSLSEGRHLKIRFWRTVDILDPDTEATCWGWQSFPTSLSPQGHHWAEHFLNTPDCYMKVKKISCFLSHYALSNTYVFLWLFYMQKIYIFSASCFSLWTQPHELSKITCYRFHSFFLIAINYCLMRKRNLFGIPLNEQSLYFQCFSTKNKAQKTFSYMYPTH